MTDTLRTKIIRLAHSKPELRGHLLPLLKSAAPKWKTVESDGSEKFPSSKDGQVLFYVTDGKEIQGPFNTKKEAQWERERLNEALGYKTKSREQEDAKAKARERERRTRLRTQTDR